MKTAPTYPVRQAAAVLLVRGEGDGREMFWVRRSPDVALGGGFYALPGGRIDREDERLAAALGIDCLRVAAARELFEETGVLLAKGRWRPEDLAEERQKLLDDDRTFEEALARLGATLDGDSLLPAGRWITPSFVPTRFDASFFVARLPEHQHPEVWPGELEDGEWLSPARALEKWRNAEALLHPPALHLARCFAAHDYPACAPAMADAPHVTEHVCERVEYQAGIHSAPLLTPTLPPATHTNCWILGDEELLVVDPGSPYEEEQALLAAMLDSLVREGRTVRAIVLTHEHPDHVGGVTALRKHLNVPVLAHRLTADRVDFPIDGFIDDGDVFALAGSLGMRWQAVHTPGHAQGHLCLFEERTGALVTGDMVAGVGTIVVNPPEGDMADYVASLRRLRALQVRAIYPAHGPTIPDGAAKLDEYLAHRAEREALVVQALAQGDATTHELVPRVYADVAEHVYPLAERSLVAILGKLGKEGRARVRSDARWTLTDGEKHEDLHEARG